MVARLGRKRSGQRNFPFTRSGLTTGTRFSTNSIRRMLPSGCRSAENDLNGGNKSMDANRPRLSAVSFIMGLSHWVRVWSSLTQGTQRRILARTFHAFGWPIPAPVRPSSVRSAMFIVRACRGSQAPVGAASHDESVAPSSMPLLTELEMGSVGWPFYKHGVPSGALAQPAKGEISR